MTNQAGEVSGLWQLRQLGTVALAPLWAVWAWVWAYPAVGEGVGLWASGLGAARGWMAAGVFWVAASASAQLATFLYNRGRRPGARLTWMQEGRELTYFKLLPSIQSGLLPAAVWGCATGLAVGAVAGPTARFLWWQWAVGGALVAEGLWSGSLWLYNRAVVPFYGPLGWEEERAGEWFRIRRLDPHRVRLTAAIFFFSWMVVVLLIGVAWLGIDLTFFARHLPPGYFSLGVAVFAGFFLAGVAFLLAVLAGWWCYLGARCYNRWAERQGGISWQAWARPLKAPQAD